MNPSFQVTTRRRQAVYATPIALVNVPALEPASRNWGQTYLSMNCRSAKTWSFL
jgi:hypothetical protein